MKRNLPNILLTAVFIIFSFWILAVKNGFMLRWFDEMSLFEPGAESLRRFLHYPGGIFRFAGTFLTQFLYYPAIGTVILIIIWLLCAWLAKISFRFTAATTPLCFLIPFCLLASVLHFDEACLSFESQGYVFYNSIGFAFSLGAYCLFTSLRHNIYAQGVVSVVLPLLYPFAGFFALLSASMCAISLGITVTRDKKTISILSVGITIMLIVILPLLYYRYFNGTTVDNDYLYLKGLPELTMEDFDWYLWSPFVIASAILLLSTILSRVVNFNKFTSSIAMRTVSIAMFFIGVICCLNADNKKSEQLRATILMVKAIEQHDWNKVMHIMSLTRERPNYTMCVLDNLARAYSGKGGRDTGNIPLEYKDFRHDEDFNITAFVNVPVNHHIGRFNQSHHWATEHIVQYGNKVFFIKYIVLNAIMNGDTQFARKFNRLLMRTMFHRKWAEEMTKYIDDPSLVKTIPDYDFLMALRAEEMMRGE